MFENRDMMKIGVTWTTDKMEDGWVDGCISPGTHCLGSKQGMTWYSSPSQPDCSGPKSHPIQHKT